MSLTTSVLAAVPNPGAVQPPGTQHATTAISYVLWIAGALLLVGAIIAGAMLAYESHHGMGGSQATARLSKVIGGCIVLACASQVINALI